MDYSDIYFLINLDTDDLAEKMIREEDEEYPLVEENEHIDNLLEEENLSISTLENSFATISNINKKLYIQFDVNEKTYHPTFLEYIELPKFIQFARFFDIPQKVKIIKVSPQIGGYIDTNYGIKFKIEVED